MESSEEVKEIVGQVGREFEQQEATPKRKRRSRAASPDAGQETKEAAKPTVVAFVVKGENLRQGIGPFLEVMAGVTQTTGPTESEVNGISDALALGLNNTKLAMDPSKAPWVPLIVALALYSIPRAMEAAVGYAERRDNEAANASGNFRGAGLASGDVAGSEGEADRIPFQG